MAAVTGRPENRIVVATQVVEAGIDLNAAVLITEAAPWPSLVQRAGRCNRTGRVARRRAVVGSAGASRSPTSRRTSTRRPPSSASLEGAAVTGEDLLGRDVAVTEQQVAVLRRSDFIGLFDTAPDLSGDDIDIAPYVRDADDLDAQLAWATWTRKAEDGRPPADAKAPAARVPLPGPGRPGERPGQATCPVWRLDQVLGRWTRVDRSRGRARPGEVLLVSRRRRRLRSRNRVRPGGARARCPAARSLVTGSRSRGRGAGRHATRRRLGQRGQQRDWMSLDQHSQETRDQAAALLSATLRPSCRTGPRSPP